MKVWLCAFPRDIDVMAKTKPIIPPVARYLLAGLIKGEYDIEIIDPYYFFDNTENIDNMETKLLTMLNGKEKKGDVIAFSINSFN